MAVDGMFRLELELARFLDRFPKLKSAPRLSILLEKGDMVTEDEVVDGVCELVLHPNYTIPLLGCFRPIAQMIVERTVNLLHNVNLRSDDDNYMEEFDEDGFLRESENVDIVELSCVIGVYERRRKGLRLHEIACLAFVRAVNLIDSLLGSILNYLKLAPAPFERIMQSESVSKALYMGAEHLLKVVRTSYRFLIVKPDIFSTMWNWSCFLDYVQQSTSLDPVNDAKLREIMSDLRWCSVGIISVVLKLSFEASANLLPNSEEAFQSLLRWEEYCMDVSLENGGWHLESSAEETHAVVDRESNVKYHGVKKCRLSSFLSSSTMAQETISSYQISELGTWSPANPFILTSALTKSFEMVSLAVSQRWPVLLYGPAGAGKTALIQKLAHNHGSKVLSIHMDEQIDGKTLIGSYVSAEGPVPFRWQRGSLTQAVINGSWVVFEDIDKAPTDVLSVLLPLLDGAATFSTGQEVARVHEDFRLFSTVTSLDISHFTQGRSSLGGVWRKVMIGPPNNDDLLHIMLAWYPELKHLATKIIETFETVNHQVNSSTGLTVPPGCINRFTSRDLLKLCKRIASLGFCFDEHGLSSYACNSIYKEAIDVFASFSTSTGNRLAIMGHIAKLWSVSAADTLYLVNKPIIQELHSAFQVGRVNFLRAQAVSKVHCFSDRKPKPFVKLRSSVHALERIACSVKHNEPVLLVGETGTGKTTLVQTLATRLHHKLTVLNLSQQSDVADLLGGLKPMDSRSGYIELYHEFEKLFTDRFRSKDNELFLFHLKKFLHDKNWKMLVRGFQKGVEKINEIRKSSSIKKRKRPLNEELIQSWEDFEMKLEAHDQISSSDKMVFSFVEGPFIKALKNGEWILLDEVNLAPLEILQRVIGVLEDDKGSLCLPERGDTENVRRHPDFRIFACMNPATDAGKRDLPFSLRSRFTEYFVDDVLDDEDLVLFIDQFKDDDINGTLISKIVQFYKVAKESEERLQDGANQKPHYSLRSLYRALEYLKFAKRQFGFKKSLYDGFCMFFQNLLDGSSAKLMNKSICKYLLDGKAPPELPFYPHLISKADDMLESYVLTESVKKHLDNLARAIFIRRYPVLLQGPTSSGKTSLVWFLAEKNGREFVRINNHEHTDLQEYLGSYITDASGKLVFQEGALVKAVRNGHWIVLDELNLAPSDVLEALNRLLDDNRELYVPELDETITAHSDFMLFATQNPPVVYGGRKILSRAFRNRFVEIHVEEIPQEELGTILEKRCKIAGSYAKKMVEVMKELQLHRQSSKIFAGKHGFITPRDLFRWADRFREYDGNSYEHLGRHGYYLIAERLRDDAEKKIVKEVLERKLRIKLSEDDMYKQEANGVESGWRIKKHSEDSENIGKIIWTRSMRRMYFLVNRCYEMREPVLLVGETGGGKTTICQLLSIMLGSKLHVLNCHQYTETSDFLGGFHPVRERWKIAEDFQKLCDMVNESRAIEHFPGDKNILTDINQSSRTLSTLSTIIKKYRDHSVSHPEVSLNEVDCIEQLYLDLCQLHQKWRTIFMWQDGPLLEAMKRGELLLVDEISLADDSVLERLNSVLEPERKLSLAEKGGSDLENVSAHPDFFLLATMNPGGDYGKKELSPALRNRFTEIWVPSVNNGDELRSIALGRILHPELAYIVNIMVDFWEFFNHLGTGRVLTVRDLLSWVSFINVLIPEGSVNLDKECSSTSNAGRNLPAESAFVHGAFLVLLDGLSLGTNILKDDAAELRMKCLSFLLEKLKKNKKASDSSYVDGLESYGWAEPGIFPALSDADNMEREGFFGIHPFYIEKGADQIGAVGFEFRAPTTHKNTFRVLRAMQLNKPVLLEGSPGVGKTSLIVSLGNVSGHTVVRINLSEQTDIMDLLGSDLPVESDEGIQFAWSDGILLQALKKGSWVLLDELNLAPQSVLEGLNAILDHRAEVFIPELGRSFKCPKSFRVFACQNPSYQGGGRKGLPKSFLNRFTKVYVDELVDEDYLSICTLEFPSIERSLLLKLIVFNRRLLEETMLHHKFGQIGSPWEFNLRDVKRSCQIIQGAPEKSKSDCFLHTIYLQRMRTTADRLEVVKLYEQVFGSKPFINPYPGVHLDPRSLIVGDVSMERYRYQLSGKSSSNLKILPSIRHCLEAVGQCVKEQWLCILVGPPSSGKTSLIRLLAELTGNVLHELHLSSTTDISELLGCFEQHNASRHYQIAISRVERYINEYCNLQLESFPWAFSRRKNLIARWGAFSSNINNCPSTASILQLVDIIECLKMDKNEQTLPLSWSEEDLESTLNVIRKLERDGQGKEHSVKFEWVAGLMIKAIENGEWIVLENANLCNPTVLDRINSLVEQSGSITINECGIVEGKPVVLHPHTKFRMFLTVNPSYGEMSRAMRNRGVEIFLMQPYWLLEGISSKNLDEIELRDVKRFIALSGIPVGKLVDMMAEAHVFARREGSRFDVTISYLELSRWVQLFQQLITNGNQPAWSIRTSWEHTYLSSFGEGKGKDIVSQAAVSYLSTQKLYQFTSSDDCLLCLPGGWPTPLKLKDYVLYSKEACVRQSCIYLESLGSQIASHKIRDSKNLILGGEPGKIYQLDAVLLQRLMFPMTSRVEYFRAQNKLNIDLAQRKLSFAADWVIEQATRSDLWLYALWFEWFGSQLRSSVELFDSFASLLKMCLGPLGSILPVQFIDINPSVGLLNTCRALVLNSPNCVSLLRRSFHQWSIETSHINSSKPPRYKSVLISLRRIEEKVIDLLAGSLSFDVTFRSYNDLLELHILFWESLSSSQNEQELSSSQNEQEIVFWRYLMKHVLNLKQVCPKEVEMFQIDLKKLNNVPSSSRNGLLWKYGGHPILPSSADLYQKQCQLTKLCEDVWPRTKRFLNIEESELRKISLDVALSSSMELRLLALQGFCMASLIISKADDTNFEIIQQLQEMYQMLFGRLNLEKHKLVKLQTAEDACFSEFHSVCCVFSPNILCRESGFKIWLQTQPISDETSLFLDLELLQHLTKIAMVDTEEQRYALCDLSDDLKSSLEFSLNYSSRPPSDFLPHQKILWTIDAWSLVDKANEKVCSFIMEMWFRWHTTLWDACPVLVETLHKGKDNDTYKKDEGPRILLPRKLFRPLKMAVVDQILQSADFIIDYPLNSLKLRAASRSIWYSSANMINSHNGLLCIARSLFQQIIYAHKKSFEDSKYAQIMSAFHSIQELRNPKEEIKVLVSLLASSEHISTPLIKSYIEPLLNELYPICASDDVWQSIGCAFLRIGGLRYNLLKCCYDLDPTVKYSIMYAELTEKIASLETEIQVREECAYLAGSTNLREVDDYRTTLLDELNAKRRRLQKKMVFRSDPGKFNKLKKDCDEFLRTVEAVVAWIMNAGSLQIKEVTKQVYNWQEITSCFIRQLSEDYPAYMDILEPVQIASYEIKLGMSLIESSLLSKEYLGTKECNMELVLGTIYLLMRFPRVRASKPFKFDRERLFKFQTQMKISTHDIDLPTCIEDVDMNLVQKLIGLTAGNISDEMVPAFSVKVAIYHNILSQIRDSVADARFLGDSTFKRLHEIFDGIASLWMKHRIKPEEESKDHQFKFRPRAFNIESIIHVGEFDRANWDGEPTEQDEKENTYQLSQVLEQDREGQEFKLDNIIDIHNQLFGSVDLVQRPGCVQVTDMDRLSSFLGSYMLGVQMTKDLKGPFSSNFDAKIAPEHVFRLCLEHDSKFILSRRSTSAYNFYKDSNPPMMAKLVEPVLGLKQRILFLSKEWDDPAAFQEILKFIDRILELDLSTALAKALSGLEFLLVKVQNVQSTVAKFPLSDHLSPIFDLACSWYKLEFESWPALLDEVQSQFERNAGKLWIPLYAILRRSNNGDTKEYNKSTIESLEDFFRTSSIGEFRKQLQLLLSFHGHIVNDLTRSSDRSPFESDTEKILYNTCGFYMQLLPRILEHIGERRKGVERKLQEQIKLCRWGRVENHIDMDRFKRSRIKLKEIVKKYTEILQQPLMEFLGQEASQSGINTQSHGPLLMVDSFERSKTLLDTICNQAQSKENSISFASSWKSLEAEGELIYGIKGSMPSESSFLFYFEERKQLWHTIENLCQSLNDYGELWEDKGKKSRKTRALSDLLKILESCGLSKHRTFVEDQSDKSESWLLQPSFELQHLMLTQNYLSSANINVGRSDLQSSSWETANNYYFKNIASIKYLETICLSKHKDFTLEEVKKAGSFVNHLIEIQQQQRVVAYDFTEQLKCLRQCMWPLSNLFSSEEKEDESYSAVSISKSLTSPQKNSLVKNFSSSISLDREISSDYSFIKNQLAIFECMWQQKQLIDAFFTMLHEESLLLQTVERNHLNVMNNREQKSSECPSVKQGAEKIRTFIQKEIPGFHYSKNRLDSHLLGSNEDITMAGFALHPYGVTRKMEKLVKQNFELIKAFENKISAFHGQEDVKGGVKNILLEHFSDLFGKAASVAEEFYSTCETNQNRLDPSHDEEKLNGLKSGFDVALTETYEHILHAFGRVGSLNDSDFTGEWLKNIENWKNLLERDINNMKLKLICESVTKTILAAGELINSCDDGSSSINVCEQLRRLYVLLDKLLDSGDNLLHDFLVIHSSVSAITYVLANIFASLFSKGYGTVEEEEENDSSKETTQDANGTGMGEGVGVNDVSNQIEDEDQLLGISDKANEEQDAKSDQPSKTEKGIEMEQDFTGDTFSVSEDSEDDDNEDDDQDEQPESAMGELGEESEIVDEKLGGMDDDDENENQGKNEKYEQGPSVKDKTSHDEELRPRDDSACEDTGDLDPKETNKHNDENGTEEDGEGAEDMSIDKDDTFADPSGINPEEQNQISDEDTQMNDIETNEPIEDDESEDLNGSDAKNDEDSNLVDESLEEADSENSPENGTSNTEGIFPEKDAETDGKVPKKDDMQSAPHFDNFPSTQSAAQPNESSDTAELGEHAPDEKYSDFSEFNNDLAQTGDLPNAQQHEVRVSNSNGKEISHEHSRTLLPPDSLNQKPQPNPCRDIGDALKGWKERVNVYLDLQDQIDNSNDLMDEDADEYGYIAEFKEDTAQALGPATADQTSNEDMSKDETEGDLGNSDRKNPTTEMDIEKQTFETGPIRNSLNPVNDVKKQPELPNLGKQPEESMEVDANYNIDQSESLVSVSKSYTSEDNQVSKFSFSVDEPIKADFCFDLSTDTRNDAASLWRSYEMRTTRLSQELAEQLRLVMEPTIASKLQGDYKTGKRINLKKVIQYIASQYRKDKIWLRRTRPSKRDYQVVIVVDDSRSMSERHCGNFAIEALVTVCRAMSQLEVGNFAVTSFGQEGNVRVLHDFDQPFSPEAGIKMISNLTFKQENTVTDNPMVDLLNYLNNMLSKAVMHARLPFGDNPLQQLVLIISDGHSLDDKENLKRRIRDLLRKKCMIAFLILDNPNESIMDALELTLEGKDNEIKSSRKIDSFPFPYYVVLKNIEALPRTLADLLRQWFELMQNSRD